jgi:hypothetical protein
MRFDLDHFDKIQRIVVGWVSIAASLIGGFIALHTYLQSAESERAKETLKYRERFDLPRYVVPIKKIEESLKKHEDELTRAIELGDQAATRTVTNLIQSEKIDIDSVVDIYEEIYLCIEAKLCDRDIATRFFGKRAYEMYGPLGYYIKAVRLDAGDNRYGRGLQFFFRQWRGYVAQQPESGSGG